LARQEIDLSYSDEPCEGGGILIRGRLKHLPSCHYEDSFMPAPPDTTGGKSNVQAVGSTNSFLRRYVACNIFNIVVVGDDEDGNGGTIDEAQTETIVELIKKAKVGPKFLKYMWAQSVAEAGSLVAAVATIAARDYRKTSARSRNRSPNPRPVMPIFHDVAQYSEAYDRLKLGIPTSSNFHKIITPQGKPSKQWREYACVLITERLLQRRIEFYNSPAMERGLIVEAEAVDWYEFDQDVEEPDVRDFGRRQSGLASSTLPKRESAFDMIRKTGSYIREHRGSPGLPTVRLGLISLELPSPGQTLDPFVRRPASASHQRTTVHPCSFLRSGAPSNQWVRSAIFAPESSYVRGLHHAYCSGALRSQFSDFRDARFGMGCVQAR
jgi:hypothetical protein